MNKVPAYKHRLLIPALIVFLALALLPGVQKADSAGSGSFSKSGTTVSTVVQPVTDLTILYQAPELVITRSDIERGYVEVEEASHIEIWSNSRTGYLLIFEGLEMPFRKVSIRGLGNEVQINSGGGWSPRPYTRGKVQTKLSYRFILSDKARPGSYAWPLRISTRPLDF